MRGFEFCGCGAVLLARWLSTHVLVGRTVHQWSGELISDDVEKRGKMRGTNPTRYIH